MAMVQGDSGRFEYAVTHRVGNRDVCKIIVAENKSDVKERIRNMFGIKNPFAIEVYNSKHELYVEADTLPNDGKLRVVVIDDAVESATLDVSSDISTASTLPVIFEEPPEVPLVPSPSYMAPAFGTTVLAPDDESSSSVVPEKTRQDDPTEAAKETAKSATRPPFLEDSLPRAVKAKLLHEESLTRSDWMTIMDAVYEAETETTLYPTSKTYESIAQGILDHYPYLRGGLTGFDARCYIKAKVVNKFRNKRRHSEKPAVVKKPKASTSLHDGLPNYLPEMTTSKLEATAKANELKACFVPAERRRLLDETYPARRHFLVDPSRTMADFFERYPALASFDELWEELARCHGAKDGRRVHGEAITAYKHLLEKVQQKGKIPKGEEDKALDALLECLGTRRTDLVNPESVSHPHIAQDEPGAAFTLKVGGQTIAVPSAPNSLGLEEALLGWAACFPVFNFKFPHRRPRDVAILLYRSVLGINGGAKLPQAALKFLKELE